MWSFVERHSFCRVSGKSPKTMKKLYFSIKFLHQEIRWSYGIFRSDSSGISIHVDHYVEDKKPKRLKPYNIGWYNRFYQQNREFTKILLEFLLEFSKDPSKQYTKQGRSAGILAYIKNFNLLKSYLYIQMNYN